MKSNTKHPYTFLSKDTIREIYEWHCEEMKIPFVENQFEDFLDFLAIDIYDWVSGNIKYFATDDYTKKERTT